MRAMHLGITIFPFNWAMNIQIEDVHYWEQLGPFAVDFGWDPGDENL